ncbi:3-hydroxybutyrate oligomer hydrolase family protein [Pseudomarimonas arenosa]|uniref:Uncharacterized protein n=1 Tax=Pseudomarimonas arenosa TaxID=2774145 RepID=A0AAW3ZM23_9GAMM|nr:3-hydroxybutyrate oligomer hydrolase family protein [Pseudomarimonas arenosa]MBD8525351.1 hypothetical protein [Pseudomarimonas arenosa]
MADRTDTALIAFQQRLYDDTNDLLSAGLGLEGLQRRLPAPEEIPAADELRRRAIWHNWNGIACLSRDPLLWREVFARPVPGREWHALLRPPGAEQPHRVMLQVPTSFDPRFPRLLALASSGSRGIFGSQALAAWGLSRGYAVVNTDKACGTDWFDCDALTAPGLDGVPTDDPRLRAFNPTGQGKAGEVWIKHAHSSEHPESRWGACVSQAVRQAWAWLSEQHEGIGRNRLTLAAGLSNGGAAVLRAAADPAIDGVVAAAPNVYVRGGGRSFFHYAQEAALWMPLAQADRRLRDVPTPLPFDQVKQMAEQHYQALREAGLLDGESFNQACRSALRRLRRSGWTQAGLGAARLSTAFDFWFAAMQAYTPALARLGTSAHPLGAHYCGQTESSSPAGLIRALRWSDGAGIVPGADVMIKHSLSAAERLRRVNSLLSGGLRSELLRGMAATHCPPAPLDKPIYILHGVDDGLIPAPFSSQPYVRRARSMGANVESWLLPRRPHFDAFLGLPGYGEHREALLPQVYRALDDLARRFGSRSS